MKKDIEIIIDNIKSIKSNRALEKKAYDLWMRELVASALRSGYSSYKDFSTLFHTSDISDISEVLVGAKYLRHEALGVLHSDFTTEMVDRPPYIVSNFCDSLSQMTYVRFFLDSEYKIIPRHSFADIFEDVFNETSNYCIAPIENTDSGKLDSIYDFILKYNLKIVKVCDIKHPDAEKETRFALLTSAPISLLSLDEGNDHFEILIYPKNRETIPNILEAARLCKMNPERIDSLPISNLNKKYSFRIVFEMMEEAKLLDLLVFLILEGIRYIPIGFFKINE